tara:strand:+ start:1314 stop:1526 length:213 start_codon:yes stop_codon:yes gene_type:complete
MKKKNRILSVAMLLLVALFSPMFLKAQETCREYVENEGFCYPIYTPFGVTYDCMEEFTENYEECEFELAD